MSILDGIHLYSKLILSTFMNQSSQNGDLVVEPRKVGYIWVVYLLLYAIAIPWYWPEGYRGPLILGFPLWVAVSLGAVLLLAVWTAWVIRRYWIMAQEDE